ncbi:MAG: SEL1-like repeat protein [Candidatus Didemnitutus sp.]|nr:SEL1-like repeat protein [Candidatus Didemnitutus sp.]
MTKVFRLLLCGSLLATGLCLANDAPPASSAAENDEPEEMVVTPSPSEDPRLAPYWRAVKLLDSTKPEEQAAGRTALQSVADSELTHAQVLLASFHFTGAYGFKEDRRKAANLMQLAAARGNGFARVSLGVCHLSGIGVRRSKKLATDWLQAALAPDADFTVPVPPAELAATAPVSSVVGDQMRDPANVARATAEFFLGTLATDAKNFAAAQTHYLAAANAGPGGRDGLYPAALLAAVNYAFGSGVPRDATKASELLATARRLSARASVTVVHNYSTLKSVDDFAVADLEIYAEEQAENQQQLMQLGIAAQLADKKSKEYNPAEAVRWYEIAAESDQVWAMNALGLLLSRTDSPVHDPARAFHWFERAGGGEKPKNTFATMNLAICLQHGIGTAPDPAKAAALFARYRTEQYLGYLGANGRAPDKVCSDEDVVALLRAAVKKKDHYAEFFLGQRYFYGLGVEQDVMDALHLLKRAAKANVPEALLFMGNIYDQFPGLMDVSPPQSDIRALDLYKRASEAGLAEASACYAYLAANGRGMSLNPDLAEAYYRTALKQEPEHARAHNNLGSHHEAKLEQAVLAQDEASARVLREKMLTHFAKAAELGFGPAALNLGRIYHAGRLVPQDFEKAYSYFDRASELGVKTAHFHLGEMHAAGEGLPVTPTEAAYHYRLAALEGHALALRRLIDYYLTGQATGVDLDRGSFWIRYSMRRFYEPDLYRVFCDILIRKGEYSTLFPLLRDLTKTSDVALVSYAHAKLAVLYRDGLGVKPSARRAKKHAELAARGISSEELVRLAMGLLEQKKLAEGVALMRQAADRASNAKFYLAQMFYFGTNVEKDEAQALELFRAAAKENQSDAQYFLAALTYNGAAGAPTMDEALELARQAERNGHAKAAELRPKLEARRGKAAPTAPVPEEPKN